mmetsp:Transcript_5480/g.7406  ORF Transcript_5480/g.7406 Transcript_5480/m.7406 type:complete len:186 (-) Transcript_5480:206-763(-)
MFSIRASCTAMLTSVSSTQARGGKSSAFRCVAAVQNYPTSMSGVVGSRACRQTGGASLHPAQAGRVLRRGDRARGLTCCAASIQDTVAQKNAENAVMIYSKTYCPYCSQVKSMFKDLGVPATVVELDQMQEEGEIQGALLDLTGQRTVPNVFIGGNHVGGCDDTMALKRSGKLNEMLEAAGVQIQ